MFPKRSDDYSALPRRERLLVLYAHAANADTWGGGFSAMRKAERSHIEEAYTVVAEVYGRSSGRVAAHLDAYACGECGTVHYGANAAARCCTPSEDGEGEGGDQ